MCIYIYIYIYTFLDVYTCIHISIPEPSAREVQLWSREGVFLGDLGDRGRGRDVLERDKGKSIVWGNPL